MDNSTPKADRRRQQDRHGSAPVVNMSDDTGKQSDVSNTSAMATVSTEISQKAASNHTSRNHIGKAMQASHKHTKRTKSVGNTQTSSHSNSKAQPTKAGTPVKAAYAGPTFHSSPAPSALPMPSFLSKSVPSAIASTTPRPSHDESEEHIDSSSTSSASGPTTDTEDRSHMYAVGREPSPLDFLFDAARQARRTPHTKSPSNLSNVATPRDESPSHRAQSTRDGNLSPFEVDGFVDQPSASIGPAFATPYQERMNALKASRPKTNGERSTLNENERMAKTEALKNLLLKSQSPRSASNSPGVLGSGKNRNDSRHSSNIRLPLDRQLRPSSGPATPSQPSSFGPGRTYYEEYHKDASQPRGVYIPRDYQQSLSTTSPKRTNVCAPEPSPSQTSFSQARNRFPQYNQGEGISLPPWSSGHGPSPDPYKSTTPDWGSNPKTLADDLRRALQLGEQSTK